MANTMTLIASYAATGSVSFIDFSSIPSTYTDLCLKVSARSSSGGGVGSDGLKLEINNSTANFSNINLYGVSTSVGTGAGSSNYIGVIIPTSPATANTFGSAELYFPNYSGSTNKSFSSDGVTENNSASANELDLNANLWSQTAAINQLTLKTLSGSSFVQYTSAYLYGIVKS
jgi:hypothetical protein